MDAEKEQNIELNELRSRLRDAKLEYRQKRRETLINEKRFVRELKPVECVSATELISLAKSLKHKNQITCESLKIIMNTLLEDRENISAFLTVDGALPALLRALSGQNEKFQLLAARCICNLSLGNSKLSLKVLKAADSYMFAHLSGKNNYIKEACAIAVGNFSTHGKTHIELLLLQGIFSKLIESVKNSNEMSESCLLYALTQMIFHGFDMLGENELQTALINVTPIYQRKSFLVVFLMSVLSASKACHQIMQDSFIHIQTLKYLLISVKDSEYESIYYLRILSNCVSSEIGLMAKDLIQDYNYLFKECLKLLLQSNINVLKKECLGLVGNLLNHSSPLITAFGLEILEENYNFVKDFFEVLENKNLQYSQ